MGQMMTNCDFYCTLGDHCTAIFEPNQLKFMSFWKCFKRSFRWDQPNFWELKRLKAISKQSWSVQPAKITTTPKTSFWPFFVQKPKFYQFFCRIPLNGMCFCQKNQQFWFSSFFTTTSIRGWFLANLATLPPPHGSPHPTTHLTTYLYVFCVQRAQKRCLVMKI